MESLKQIICSCCFPKLQKHLESCPVVYSYKITRNEYWDAWSTNLTPKDTHKAYLFGAEEITPKVCEHRPIYYRDDHGFPVFEPKCESCGIELESIWQEKK